MDSTRISLTEDHYRVFLIQGTSPKLGLHFVFEFEEKE